MPLTPISHPPTSSGFQHSRNERASRPHFNTHLTSDRLREGSMMRQPLFKITTNIRKGRKSVFREVGLEDEFPRRSQSASPVSLAPSNPDEENSDLMVDEKDCPHMTTADEAASKPSEPSRHGGNLHADDSSHRPNDSRSHRRQNSISSKPWFSKIANVTTRPRVRSTSGAPPGTVSGLQRFTLIALLIAVVLPALSYRKGDAVVGLNGADAGVIRTREKSPIQVCARWAQQTALVNGTLYIYGGNAKQSADQNSNTWNNNFLTLDLTRDWDTDSAALTGLTVPDGPPAVALGYLWHDYNNLYLYGGQFSDSPYVDPAPESIWQYGIKDGTWTEFKNPETSSGNYSEPSGQPVRRAAEGAGISVPELGLSWYFGGHLDWATVPGWSRQTDRVYLKSLLEFTHPGYINTGVESLSGGTGAPSSGAFRNITEGGVQANEFTERADGVLVFVPGWGESGVLIGLAGGTWDTFVRDLGVLDVYDIANSKWFHQETSGDIPGVRVNPCAVVASAPDASSFQIYMYGGQNLQPAGDQTQYDDMYILTIPAFTWIKVDQSDQSAPSARAGHTCSLRDGQMIVVGGYTGPDAACDSPGIYVFDASTLKWQNSFKAGGHDASFSPDNTVLAGSYGYTVPDAVQSVIGGGKDGGATATKPVSSANGGPFATGKPPIFTVTNSGATATVTQFNGGNTAAPTSNSGGGSHSSDPGTGGTSSSNDHGNDDKDKVNPGLIAAGAIAGLTGALALYLGFCAWLYRRQVSAYKQHLAVANRFSGASSASFRPSGFWGAGRLNRHNGARRGSMSENSSHSQDESFGWVGSDREPNWLTEPKWLSEDPSLRSHSGTASGSGMKRSEETRPGTSGSSESTEGLLDGQEPSFFSVVMGPRRALRVVNSTSESP